MPRATRWTAQVLPPQGRMNVLTRQGCWQSCRLLHRRDDRPHQGVQVVAVAAVRRGPVGRRGHHDGESEARDDVDHLAAVAPGVGDRVAAHMR